LQHPSIAPYGAYRSADDHTLVISIQNDREWQRFAQSFLQRPALGADERFARNALRVRHRDALDALIQNAFRAMLLDMAIAALNQGARHRLQRGVRGPWWHRHPCAEARRGSSR
jgi:itaconate CoA-transferase